MRIAKRKLGASLLAAGVITVTGGFLLEGPAAADPVYDETQFDAHLHDAHHGSTWASAEKGTCPAAPEGKPYGWHFVTTGTAEFAEIRVTFQTAGEVTTGTQQP